MALTWDELAAAALTRVRPRFYLSTEWGVPFETVAIAIPFYLARPDLTALHAERVGHVEGFDRADILRYLRHEMGHVVNYAYRLYDEEEWVKQFGSITQPYTEEYRPEPFSRRYVRHLPGWYAQKHPDEDWAETFAVWMTPGRDWRAEYAGWPEALAKLDYCDRTMAALADRKPLVTADELDVAIPDGANAGAHTAKASSPGAWQMTVGKEQYTLANGRRLVIRGPKGTIVSKAVEASPFSATFPGAVFGAKGDVVVTVA